MQTKHLLRTSGLALTWVVAVVPGAYANPYQFAAIDVPGATITVANQVNDTGQIVGTYVDATGTHGFVQDGPTVTRIDPPGSTRTYAWGINDTGQVVGSFNDATGIHGFLKDGPSYTALDAPGAGLTAAWDINNAGQIVGEFNIVSGLDDHGFLKDGAVYTTIDVPGYAYAGAFGINNFGQIVGTFSATLASQDLHAFLKDGATLSVIDVPGATFTNPWGINDAGQITGVFQDAAGFVHGFLRDGATLSVIDFPGAAATAAFGINDRGQIIGSYDDAAGLQHSFLATPVPEPAALHLLTLGVLGLWAQGRRKRRNNGTPASSTKPALRPAVWALPLLLATAPAGAQVQFTVTDLGSFNATTSTAYGLNTAGQVAGYSAAPGSAAQAFLWSSGTLQSLSAPGANISSAYAVSPTGQVVGFASSNGLRRAVTWRSGVMQDLGTLGGSFSDAYGINAAGQIVGDAYLAGNSTYHAYLWQPGGMQDLGTLGGTYSTARGINAAGQVTGFSARADGSVHAFVSQSGGLQDLGTLGGSYSYANTINAAGQIAGSSTRSDGATHAFLWRSGAAMQDLGTLGGSYSAATAINAVGQVVGASSLVGTGPRHAFLRGAQGGMVDVNDLLVAGSGATVSDAVGVNDYGQIAGAATFTGNTRAVLLTPTGSIHWLASGSTGSGGNFLDGANWEQGFRPSPFLDVFIAPTGSPPIDLNIDAAIKHLSLGAAAGSSGRPQLVLHDGARLSASNGVTVLTTGLLSGDGTVAGRLDNFGTVRPGNLSIVGPFTNAGLVAGSGYLNANLNNAASGQVQSGSGDMLHIVGATHVNQGTLDISGGGTQQYSGPLANMAGGRILLNNAALRLDAGLSNAGQLQVSFGGATVYGNITTQAGGKIILSGNSDTTFFDAVDVESGGELRVSAGSSAAFFGLVRQRTGAVFSGSGTKFYEGGLSIGDSPGLGIDGGSVAFGSGSTYLEEIGGTAAGLEFDKYIVSGRLGFGGTLKVVWWNGYSGQVGQRFDLFDWGHSTGTFAALDFSAAPLAHGLVWDVSQLYTTGEIGISAVPEPASWALLLAGLLLWAPRRLRRQALTRTGCAAALMLAAGGASAQVWTNPSVGDWFIAGNWNPFVPAAGSLNAAIDNGGLALIHSPGAAVGFLHLGNFGGAQGNLDVAGTGTLTGYGWLDIAHGTVEIRAGAKVTVADNLITGNYLDIGSGGTSRLLVKDPGSSMIAGTLLLGTSFNMPNGIGFSSVLSVENGGSFDTTNATIVNASSASVSGVNSLWMNGQYLNIRSGSSLAVRDQAIVSGGYSVDLYGSASVSTGALLSTTGTLRVGDFSSRVGLLSVQSSGAVISAQGEVGYGLPGAASSGRVAISGAGSAWFNAGVLVVGGSIGSSSPYFGSGTISIDKGGWLASGASTVGNQAGSYGKVTVDGAGSRWNSSGDIVVGNLGIGIVEVTNGAQLGSVRGHVGYAAGSTGAVTVSGAGSSWAASGSLFIGNAGNGQLNVLDGAVVSTAGNSYLGFAAGSQGAATVNGAGSVWNTTAAGTNLNIGGSQAAAGGVGTLSIGPGGAVHTAAANLYATGTLLLTGDAVFTGPITAYGSTVRSIGVSSLGSAISLGAGGLSVQPRDPASKLTFSGNISGTGGLYKSNFIGTGSGTLVLTGNNTYTGATIIDIGKLLVNGTQTSMVQVNSGALGGTGAILATVQVGNDVGTADATIAPGGMVNGLGTLSTGDLNIRADGVYAFQIDSLAAAADRIVVTGSVVLANGATFSLNDTSAASVAPGMSFVAIANDGVDAIVGQFANLAQGGIFSVGANSYQASYFGGTGNDLVLTAVPVPEPARPALLLCGLVAVALWQLRRRRDA